MSLMIVLTSLNTCLPSLPKQLTAIFVLSKVNQHKVSCDYKTDG